MGAQPTLQVLSLGVRVDISLKDWIGYHLARHRDFWDLAFKNSIYLHTIMTSISLLISCFRAHFWYFGH